MSDNYFVTPTDPEGFSVNVPTTNFRSIDYSALEFDTLNKALIEYVRTYYRDEFNDFVASNGFMMLSEILCYIGASLAEREDIIANDNFLPTANSITAVTNHVALVGQEFRRQTPATTQVMCSVDFPVATDIKISAGTQFSLGADDGRPLVYELYGAPYDWGNPVVIPAKKYARVAWAIEGQFANPYTVTSEGGNNQEISIIDNDVLDEPVIVKIDGIKWSRVKFLEDYLSNDKIYKVAIVDDSLTVRFGDNVNGKAPLTGQEIEVTYRVGGGSRGRIGTGVISSSRNFVPEYPLTNSVSVSFRNISPSSGGYDAETIEDAKKRVPKEWSTHNNIATGPDYINVASNFNHPVYGGVSKAVATVQTSLNANLVILYILADGEGDTPVKPNLGLKNGLKNYINKLNVLTDDIEVRDGDIKLVDVDMTVVIYNNAEAGSMKSLIDGKVDNFFSTDNWNMGQPLYVSNLYNEVMSIDGVKFVDIFSPSDDILFADDVGTGSSKDSVEFNELITLGNKNIRVYYEK